MELLKEKILNEATVKNGKTLVVDSFLNHKMDIRLFDEMALEFKRRFEGHNITKILTLEVSGIGISCVTAMYFDVPVLLAKKSNSIHLDGDVFEKEVTSPKGIKHKIYISKQQLSPSDHVLIIDDMLANGYAMESLIDIVRESGATLEGVGICIEKTFKNGGNKLRERGIHIESLAKIKAIENGRVVFEDA